MKLIFWTIEFFAAFSETFLCAVFCGTFISKESFIKKKKQAFIFTIIQAFVIILINHFALYSLVQSTISIFIFSSICFYLYKNSVLKSLALSITFILIFSAIDNMTVSAISFAFGIPSSEIYEELSLIRVFAIAISKTLLMIFTLTVYHLFKSDNNIKKSYIYAIFLISIILLVLNFTITFIDIKNENINSITTITLFVTMLVLICIIFFGSFRLANYYNTQNELSLERLKNNMLEQSMMETKQSFELIQTSLHDYKHNIISINSLAKSGDLKGIIDFTDKEISVISNRLFYYKTGNDTVDSILYIKQKTAENMNITFIINAKIPADCSVSSQHFASILGNLIDNSIEASQKESEPCIEVNIKSVNSYLAIAIKNKCSEYDPTLKTSKKEKSLHGIGIKSVKRIVKEYNGETTVQYKNQIFSVNIIIPLSKSD